MTDGKWLTKKIKHPLCRHLFTSARSCFLPKRATLASHATAAHPVAACVVSARVCGLREGCLTVCPYGEHVAERQAEGQRGGAGDAVGRVYKLNPADP